jgi:hypothetical protein
MGGLVIIGGIVGLIVGITVGITVDHGVLVGNVLPTVGIVGPTVGTGK